MSNFPSQVPGAAGFEVPQPMNLSKFREHLEICEDTFLIPKVKKSSSSTGANTTFQQEIPLADAQLLTNH